MFLFHPIVQSRPSTYVRSSGGRYVCGVTPIGRHVDNCLWEIDEYGSSRILTLFPCNLTCTLFGKSVLWLNWFLAMSSISRSRFVSLMSSTLYVVIWRHLTPSFSTFYWFSLIVEKSSADIPRIQAQSPPVSIRNNAYTTRHILVSIVSAGLL